MLNTERVRRHRLNNWLQSALMLGAMALVLVLLGWLLAGVQGTLWTAVIGVLILALGPRVSPRLVLAMYRARQLSSREAPRLYMVVEELARRAGLPSTPGLYYVPSQVMNAFTVGKPSESAIAVTDGLLRNLNLRELTGVLAHEVSHVRNNDMWVMGLADLVSRMTSLFASFGQILLLISLPLILFTEAAVSWIAILLLVLAPSFTALLQLALARTREFDADLGAAALTGDPQGLASALARLEQSHSGWLERIFIPGRRDPDPSLLRTHPATEERIQRLLSLSERRGPHGSPPALRIAPEPPPLLPRMPTVTRVPRWHVLGVWR